jgi:hypothetical protein
MSSSAARGTGRDACDANINGSAKQVERQDCLPDDASDLARGSFRIPVTKTYDHDGRWMRNRDDDGRSNKSGVEPRHSIQSAKDVDGQSSDPHESGNRKRRKRDRPTASKPGLDCGSRSARRSVDLEVVAQNYSQELNSSETDEDKLMRESENHGSRPSANEDIFVWKKKDAMLRRKGIRLTPLEEEARRQAAAEELVRAKARREERQRERDEWEAEQTRLAREREQDLNAGWDRKEDSFQGQQHFLRQAIRLRENRPTLADSLARNLRLDLLEVHADSRSPCVVIESMLSQLTPSALAELYESIQLELDYIPDFCWDDGRQEEMDQERAACNGQPVTDTAIFTRALRQEWWTCLDTFVCDLIATMGTSGERDGLANGPIHQSVREDLDALLGGKTVDELRQMEGEISRNVEGCPSPLVKYADVEFWKAALRRIRAKVAGIRIEELNSLLAAERTRMIAAIPAVEASELNGKSIDDVGSFHEGPIDLNEEEMVRAEVSKGMLQNEERFADEVQVPRRSPSEAYAWNDKYRPRKPKFFNRVHTGYDWNKYNRTHYDHDNPPPKTVQGYKFNIFYPDLIDRTVAPTFAVSRTDNPEVCILTFKSGPPYDAVAFKIVNRPWEHSHRRGFRCTFERGTLHLWFNFRRYRYRR